MNNRQAGRRRGRGGQRSPGNPQNGSRIDNRARGNANQLYEKYKTLARDAQMQGDRVNTEYYLQFADHYFRVLSESRSRFEDQNRRQRDDMDDAEDGDEDGFDQPGRNQFDADREYGRDRDREQGRDRSRAPTAGTDREARSDADAPRQRQQRAPMANGQAAADASEDLESAAAPLAAEAAVPEKRGRGRPRRQPVDAADAAPAEIDADRLPPALSVSANDDGAEKPRRRRPRAASGEATNPAG